MFHPYLASSNLGKILKFPLPVVLCQIALAISSCLCWISICLLFAPKNDRPQEVRRNTCFLGLFGVLAGVSFLQVLDGLQKGGKVRNQHMFGHVLLNHAVCHKPCGVSIYLINQW